MAKFQALAATVESVAWVAKKFPENPFLTASYAKAQQMLGAEGWIFVEESGGSVNNGCLAFLRVGRLTRSLLIPSTPSVTAASEFWFGVERFVRERKVSNIEFQTFGSREVVIPPLFGQMQRTRREEFHLDLRAPDLWSGLSSTHRRWVKKGGQNQLTIRCTQANSALQEHMILCDSSLERRRQRGEHVVAGGQMYDEFLALLQSGAGELRQAMAGDTVESSILLLRSPKGAYLVSAGTSERGRTMGASHFLVYESARMLASEGVHLFNLGGVREEETGLRAYKAAFGSVAIPLVAVRAEPGSQFRRSVTNIVRAVAKRVLNLD
jgi:hypothetical protein